MSTPRPLKTLLSSLLVTLLLLNIWGYYGVFVGLQYRNEATMRRQLDEGVYDEKQAVTIKIAVAVPYMADDTDYQQVTGKFEHQGELYRLVKQKYQNDTLTIVCIRDHENKWIREALTAYVKSFADHAGQTRETVTLPFAKDYLVTIIAFGKIAAGWESNLVHGSAGENFFSSFCSGVIQPPERA